MGTTTGFPSFLLPSLGKGIADDEIGVKPPIYSGIQVLPPCQSCKMILPPLLWTAFTTFYQPYSCSSVYIPQQPGSPFPSKEIGTHSVNINAEVDLDE